MTFGEEEQKEHRLLTSLVGRTITGVARGDDEHFILVLDDGRRVRFFAENDHYEGYEQIFVSDLAEPSERLRKQPWLPLMFHFGAPIMLVLSWLLCSCDGAHPVADAADAMQADAVAEVQADARSSDTGDAGEDMGIGRVERPRRGLGSACAGDDDCESGACAGTVCCNKPCAGPCLSCGTGYCLPAHEGELLDGTCDGAVPVRTETPSGCAAQNWTCKDGVRVATGAAEDCCKETACDSLGHDLVPGHCYRGAAAGAASPTACGFNENAQPNTHCAAWCTSTPAPAHCR
jgi:hypothetical protein